MREVKFTWEQITEDKTIETTTNVIQVSFANYGKNSIALINGFPLFPVGSGTPNINNFLFSLPMGVNEIDRTQYKITFQSTGLAPQVNDLKVWYKMTNLTQ